MPINANHRRWRYPIEGALIGGFFFILRALPFSWASTAGSLLARFLLHLPRSPLQRFDRIARRNIAACFPKLSTARHHAIRRSMWNHIGRTLCEYPHLPRIAADPHSQLYRHHVRLHGLEHVRNLRRGSSALFITGHFGNWELCPSIIRHGNRDVIVVYRRPNNPMVDRIIGRLRQPLSDRLAPKGNDGARIILKGIKQGLDIAMAVDQRAGRGVCLPFFKRPCMVSTTTATLHLKYGTPILLFHCLRRPDGRFDLTVDPPLAPSVAGNRDAAIRDITTRINRRMEEWIRAHPEQWLWIHDRWKIKSSDPDAPPKS